MTSPPLSVGHDTCTRLAHLAIDAEGDTPGTESSKDPGVPPADGVCRFLLLPAEVRNLIYELALTCPDGVTCRLDPIVRTGLFRIYSNAPGIPYASGPHSCINCNGGLDVRGIIDSSWLQDTNQLKYVCRQINAETKTVAIVQNELHFDGGIEDASDFLDIFPTSSHAHLQQIVVVEASKRKGSGIRSRAWRRVARYCEANFNASVQIRVPQLCPYGLNVHLDATVISAVTRKDLQCKYGTLTPSLVRPVMDGVLANWGISTVEELPGEPYTHNIRVFPFGTSLDEVKLLQVFKPYTPPEGMQARVAMAKDIVKNGI